ncbi:Methyltransferase type 11 domain-containing protein [Marinicrinis lubricantis]
MFNPMHYVGVDPDMERVHYARRLFPQYSFQALEPPHLPVEAHSVDYILIIAVLHHIRSEEISQYMKEFDRVLKPSGTIIVMEPCLCEQKPISSRFMKWFDKGEYIRNEEEYLHLFTSHQYDCTVLKKFNKCFLYHELFFSAKPKFVLQMRYIHKKCRASS